MKKKKEETFNKKILWGLLLVGVLVVLFLLFRNNNNVKVQFDTDGGSKFNTQFVVKDGKIVKPKKEPVKEGYDFDGWYVNDELFDFDTPVTDKLTLVAKWKKIDEDTVVKYTVNFDTDSGSIVSSMKVEEGKKLLKPTNPKKEGYEFISWQLNGKEYDFNTLIKEDITLIANWKKKEETLNTNNKLIVKFNSNGGSLVNNVTLTSGYRVSKPKDPSRKGYVFKGWFLNNKEFNFNTYINNNITLTAKWEEDLYTIEKSFFQEHSPQVKVTVKKNNIVVGAKSVLTSDERLIGIYHEEHDTILADETDYSKISKVKLNDGTIVSISK